MMKSSNPSKQDSSDLVFKKYKSLKIAIENIKGSTRQWFDPHGNESGSSKMYNDYGYLVGFTGADKEEVDVYLGPDEWSNWVYIIHQNKKPDFTEYDEDKVMLGFSSEEHAKLAYLKQYDDERFYGGMSVMPFAKFKSQLKESEGEKIVVEKAIGDDSGSQAKPSDSPRQGHKYVKRTWSGDHWEYEYAGEPHAEHHGHGHVGQSEHTVDVAPGTDTSTPGGAENAYYASRKHSLSRKGGTFSMKHPVDGRELTARIMGSGKINILDPATGTPIVRKLLRPGDAAPKRTPDFSGWSAVERWHRQAGESQKVQDILNQKGIKVASAAPNVGKTDRKSDRLVHEGVRDNQKYRIFTHPEFYGYVGKKGQESDAGGSEEGAKADNGLYASSQKHALRKIELLHNNQKRLESSAGKPDTASLLKEGMSPRKILEGDMLRYKQSPKERDRYYVAADMDPATKDLMIHRLAAEVAGPMVDKVSRLNADLKRLGKPEVDMTSAFGDSFGPVAEAIKEYGPQVLEKMDLSKMKLDPKSSAYRAINRTIDTYSPTNSTTGQVQPLDTKIHALFGDYVKGDNKIDLRDKGRYEDAEMAQAAARLNEQMHQDHIEASKDDTSDDSEDFEEAPSISGNLNSWKNEQTQKIQDWLNSPDGAALKPHADAINEMISGVKSEDDVDQFHGKMVNAFERVIKDPNIRRQAQQQVLHDVQKSLESLIRICDEFSMLKAVWLDSMSKAYPPVNPYTYMYKEGLPDHSKYMYMDSQGNYVKHTNAPEGHPDYDSTATKPGLDPSEPEFTKNPEYFTPDGRKLTRTPYPGIPVEWNQSYYPGDPNNMWAARWVNPVTGAREYSYIESDIINQQKLKIFYQNAVFDSVLPRFRAYTSALFHSPQLKDHLIGLALLLLDQGKFRLADLDSISSQDIEISGDLVRFGDRIICADAKVKQAILAQMMRTPTGPFLQVPTIDATGKPNATKIRRIGGHTLIRMCENLGVSIEALQTYHATHKYAQSVQRLLTLENLAAEVAHRVALLEVAQEMGNNLENTSPDQVNMALKLVQDTMIDPVVFEAIMTSAVESNLSGGAPSVGTTSYTATPMVTADLIDRTSAETEFSRWTHSYEFSKHGESLD
jgi:hypothetical protein